MATNFGFTLPGDNTRISQFAAVIRDLANKLDNWSAQVLPTGANLNDYKSPGKWCTAGTANATLALNFPKAESGVLKIETRGTGTLAVWQYYTTYGTSTLAPVMFFRSFLGSWSAWQQVSVGGGSGPVADEITVTDNTAGRRAKIKHGTVDEQRIYSDTGRRDITALATADDGELIISRSGQLVTLEMNYFAASGTILTLPSGWRPAKFLTDLAIWDGDAVSAGLVRIMQTGVLSTDYLGSCDGAVTWRTDDPWPAAYGVAIGPIPR